MSEIVYHPDNSDFWHQPGEILGRCWVCGDETEWIYLDLAHQHPDCDEGPSSDGFYFRTIGGVTTDGLLPEDLRPE